MMIRLLNRLLIPYLEEPSHYHKAVIGDLKRLTHPNLSDFYFSANLTPQVMIRLLNRLLIPYQEESSHYHKAVIGDLKRLTHSNLSDFYFSANLTPQVFLAAMGSNRERYQSTKICGYCTSNRTQWQKRMDTLALLMHHIFTADLC